MKHYYNVKSYARTTDIQKLPSLIDIQLLSFQDFIHGDRLLELFDEINPIQSFNGNLSLYFPGNHPQSQEFSLECRFDDPKYDVEDCLERDMSYAAALHAQVALVNHDQGDEVIRQEIFLGDFPLMTEKGTFIINGTERVVVSQLIRSPGVYFDVEKERATGRQLSNAKLIPDRGAWMEFETRKTDYITIKFNRKRTIPVTILLRALAAVDDGLSASKSPIKTGEDEEILALFADVDNNENHDYIASSMKNEPVWDIKKKQTIAEVALIEFFKRMRPGDPPTLENARKYLEDQLFDQRRYDLERVGRYKLNQRLGLQGQVDPAHRTLAKADIVALVRNMIIINNSTRNKDDIDHLGNRRVKTVGELIGNKLRIGLRRMERVVKERMSIREADQLTPISLVNIRPIVAAVREFFGSSQLSQFMEQTNPLSELTHKRTLSALGPGGLRRERAGFDVRDVHHSHYGRICPIETPEGPNIGLIGRLASYARVNKLGFIETPYRKVVSALSLDDPSLIGRAVYDDIEDYEGNIVVEEGTVVDASVIEALTNNPFILPHARAGIDGQIKGTASNIRIESEATRTVDLPLGYKALVKRGNTMKAGELLAIPPDEGELLLYLLGKPEGNQVKSRKRLMLLVRSAIQLFSFIPFGFKAERLDGNEPYIGSEDIDACIKRLAQDGLVKHTQYRSRKANRKYVNAYELTKTGIAQYESSAFKEDHPDVAKAIDNAVDELFLLELEEIEAKSTEKAYDLERRTTGKGTEGKPRQPITMPENGKIASVRKNGISFRAVQSIGSLAKNADVKPLVRSGMDVKEGDPLALERIKQIPITPFASQEIEYLSADTEDTYIIAQANAELDEKSQFVSNRVSARYDQGFQTVPPHDIDYMDIAPRQIVGISAALIPFLSHDAANRALMGSNMQRQAVPLLTPDVSVVSTGMEGQAAYDSGQVLVSDIEAEVISVQGHRVIVRTADGEEVTYQLRKYERSNQSTCIDQRPLVRKGDMIKPKDVIADSSSTYDGQLALGHDVLTCFMSWEGGNYEDALLISEEMLRNDKFTSIHIEKHEIEARDTKLGPEEITYDIPNVGEEALKDLDEHGIVRVGAEVGPNDILVGKITPKGEKELSPEEKLLRAIFGEQAREVKDSSLRLPHGDRGKVIDVKVFTRDEHPDLPAGVEKMVRVSVAQRRKLTVGDKMAGRHGNKGVISKIVPIEDMPYVEGGLPVEIILNPLGVPSRMNIGQILELHLGWAADRMGFRAVTPVFDGVREEEIQAELGRAWMLDWAWKQITEQAWQNHDRLAGIAGIDSGDFDDDMHVICAYLLDRVGESGNYDNEAIILERDEIYVRRVAVAEVLSEHGYIPDEIMVYDNSDLEIDIREQRDEAALRVSLRLWIQQTSPEAIELSDSLSIRELFDIANRVMFETGQPVPHYGKQTLYDGRTGEPFDRHVAVGYVHMLKLAHLVEDKAHARSTGPYSLVTQQPLGGKAQFGGQRFGEMEVWALEAYGAAHILQEMLTVKSDDVQGRVKTYESIVKGEPIEEPGIPTSFRVLVKELQSLGLSVEAITGSGDVIRFGKDDEQSRRPLPRTGLLSLGPTMR